jgi:transposase
MARYKPCDYNQEILVIVSLDDQLLPGSLAYGIHTQVETEMDLSIFEQRYKNDETGCAAYHPKVLLKVVLFAYSHGIVGSRRIEKLCRKHMTCMALACGYHPDHSTIAAFVSSMHSEILPLFCDILRVCEEQGLLGGTVFAVDGLKLSSNASKEWSGTCEDLKRKQEKLEAKIAQLLAEHQQVDDQEWCGSPPTVQPQSGEAQREEVQREEVQREEAQTEEAHPREATSKKPKGKRAKGQKAQHKKPKHKRAQNKKSKRAKRLKRLRRQAARIKDWLATHEPKMGKQGKEIQSNITDNESAKMPTSHGVIQGYNAQAVVDDKFQVIVAAEVFGNGQDADHLIPMVAGAKTNMQTLGHEASYFEDTIWLADSNYHSDENLKTCEQEHLDAYIPDTNFRKRDGRFATQARHKPPPKKKTFTVADFGYDEAMDRYICPNGNALRLKAREHHLRYRVYRYYVADERDCQVCPLRATCLSKKQTRRKHLGIPVEQPPRTRSQQMIQKIDTEEGRQQYSRRLEIVEPVFGNIRAQKRLDRFTLRGKQKVDIQWLLYGMVHNIEKIVNYGEVA